MLLRRFTDLGDCSNKDLDISRSGSAPRRAVRGAVRGGSRGARRGARFGGFGAGGARGARCTVMLGECGAEEAPGGATATGRGWRGVLGFVYLLTMEDCLLHLFSFQLKFFEPRNNKPYWFLSQPESRSSIKQGVWLK